MKRVLKQVSDWLHARMSVPTNDQIRSRNRDWDFAQVDSRNLWEAKADPDGLESALQLVEKYPDKGYTALVDFALAGSAIAMNAVGECCYWGRGTLLDRTGGETWFRIGFENGSQRALLNYGRALYWRNELALAEAVFRSGAEKDWAPALYWLAIILLRRSKTAEAKCEARLLLERASAKGSHAAKWRLGRDMARGGYGIRNIHHGFALMWALARETNEAWDSGSLTRPRATATGDTIH